MQTKRTTKVSKNGTEIATADLISFLFPAPIDQLKTWTTDNKMTTAELWIEFFEQFALGTSASDDIITIRSSGACSREDKQWKGKRLAIEDPFSTKRSLTRSVNNATVLDFIADCFRIGYLYFGTVQTTLGPIVTKVIVPPSNTPESKSSRRKRLANAKAEAKAADKSEDKDLDNIINKLKLDDAAIEGQPKMPMTKAITLEELEKSLIEEEEEDDENDDDDDLPGPEETFESYAQRVGSELSPKQAQQLTELVPKNMIHFKFDGDILTAGQSPMLICTVCGSDGHARGRCPDEQLPEIRPLPRSLDPRYLCMLDNVCADVMESRIPSPLEIKQRQALMEELSSFVQQTYPKALLTVFGSSVNGFSFAKSDLDISLTFTDHESSVDLNAIEIIENLAEKMKGNPAYLNVQAITSAKVPIIKFTNKMPKIECDISLYNVLAQENTRMLRTYASIDPRVKMLGYVVKEFAKRCDIGDASRGSLSSYAYILMLIYYLQQVQPPVVPVLQELHDHDPPPPVNMVDGWNAWFYSKLLNLHEVWPYIGANKMSVSELWIGFLNFYAGAFDDMTQVVSIRMKRPLGKFEKMWNSPCIAIEDPFDLSHNLGAGISRKMNIFIKTAFIRTRELFGIPNLARIPSTNNVEVLRVSPCSFQWCLELGGFKLFPFPDLLF